MSRTQIQTQIRSLSSLLDNLREGIIQVPPFQRKFVWNRRKVQELFDSIRKSYPIGSILLWRPREAPQWERDREVGGFLLPNLKEPKSYVLDGCQRLSSLFGCLNNPKTSGLPYDIRMHNEFFNLYLDLREETFIYPQGGTPRPWQVPVCILSSTSEFRQYTRNVLEPAIPDSLELDLYLDRADSFSRSLVDYKLAVIEVEGATLRDAVNIFSRINSQGTDISDDWKINALSFSEQFNFSEEVDSVIERLRQYNFDSLSRDTLFRCYQSAFDDRLYIDTDIETLARHPNFRPVVKKMSEAIIQAVDFLYHRLNVIDHKLLPYTAQLVFLSVFFLKEPSPTKSQLRDMKRWFWITTYSNYFTASSLSVQRKAFTHLLDYISGWANTPLFEDNTSDFQAQPWPRKLSLASARATALVLFQLRAIRKQCGGAPDSSTLVIKKIFKRVDTYPENIGVTFADNNTRKLLPICVPVNTDSQLPYEIEEELAMRRSVLRDKERAFVESLGIRYE